MQPEDADPYEEAFATASCTQPPVKHDAVLSETQWQSFLSRLVDHKLLKAATAARFSTDYHGLRSLRGFQDQLVRWSLPSSDPLRSLDDAFTTLEENTELVERIVTRGATPAFLPRLATRVKAIADDLSQSEAACRRELASYVQSARLYDGHSIQPTPSTTHAWLFQRNHQAFLQREERRRRPVRVECHTTDAASRQVLLETFPRRLARAQDLSVSMATVSLPVEQSTTTESSSSSPKSELVVAIALRRRHARGDEVEWLETLVAAHRELQLSPYFQQYLGCYEPPAADPTEQVHCFELAPVTTLEQLLRANANVFQPDSPIVRYFAREILLAMVDLFDQSTHEWRTRLTPANVLLSASRRRVLIGGFEFGPAIDQLACDRGPLATYLSQREAVLLNDLALLLFVMFYRSTLPANLDAFRSQYLARKPASRFTSEFVVTASALEIMTLHVCRDDRFAVLFLVATEVPWLLKSKPPQLQVESQVSMPVPSFTFVAVVPGEHRLEFEMLRPASSTGSTRVVVRVVVASQSYLYGPSTRWTTLVESCAAASPTVALRHLLDHHVLFRPLEDDADVDALEAALERCTGVVT